jgi:signal transduction histidine kinase
MTPFRQWLARGLGLRARMTASYVLVTCAAVILVEALAVVLVIPNASVQADLATRVVSTANQYTKQYGGLLQNSATTAASPAVTSKVVIGPSGTTSSTTVAPAAKLVIQVLHDQSLGDAAVHLGPGQEQTQDQGVLIPHVPGLLPDSAPMSVLLVLDPKGMVYGSSYEGRYQPGSGVATRLPKAWSQGVSGVSALAGGTVAWASDVVPPQAAPGDLAEPPTRGRAGARGDIFPFKLEPLGFVYVQVPVPAGGPITPALLEPFLQSGAILLLATIPVGVVFGLLTTRGTIRRLRRLGAGTVGFAAGDFSQRVPESGLDEVGLLERHFNQMAGRLSDSIAGQRALAERNARLAERSRISRELHDSISQDLFSISALAGGLRRALPPDSAVQPQLETLTRTVGSTIQEMRALLLELRPTALEDRGLVPALAELCEAYEVRAGVSVRAELELVALGPAEEQAVLRIAQEGLSNAVRHSEADRIRVRLRPDAGGAELTVADNGRGFDGRVNGHGLGLRLMAERVRELGGSLAVDSAPGRGTELRVLLPAAAGG